jgi:hypothetical protein
MEKQWHYGARYSLLCMVTCSNVRRSNMAKAKYFVGKEYETKVGRIKVLEIIPTCKGVPGRSNKRAVIRFMESGWTCNIQLSNLPLGKIKDRRKPSVYGVGYLDTDITIPTRGDSIIRRTYDLWANMLKRCYGDMYSRNWEYYHDVTVDKRWHSFKQFLSTIHLVDGYTAWEKDSSMHLDKDKKESRVYGITGTCFITKEENAKLACLKRWHKK